MWQPLISIRTGVRAWVRPMPMWCSRPLWRRLSLPSVSMMSRRTRACGSVLGEVARGGFGPGLIGSRGGAAAEGAVRPAAVVVGGELVAEGLQFGQGLGLPRLRSEPFLQRLLEPFHFAAGGGVVRPGVLLDHTQMAEFGLEAVDGVASGAAAGEAGGAKIPPQWGDYPCNKR